MDLPVEIISIIFTFSDQLSLVVLLRTSRLFKTLAEPLLYRNVIFAYEGLDGDSLDVCQLKINQFQQRITEAPYLAMYVISYATEYVQGLSATLPKLVNLRRLKLGSAFLPDFDQCFSPTTRLTHLICDQPLFDSDDILAFRALLESQPGLEHLEFFCNYWVASGGALSPQALPRLRTLVAGVEVAKSILPGRDIRHLKLYDPMQLLNIGSHHFFPAVHSYAAASDTPLVTVIVALFPNLKYLCLRSKRLNRSNKFPLYQVINDLYPLAAINIEYICLDFKTGFLERHRDTISEFADELAACFTELPSLRTLDFGFGVPSQPIALLFRYRPGCSAPVEINLPEVSWPTWELWWERAGLEWCLQPSGSDITESTDA